MEGYHPQLTRKDTEEHIHTHTFSESVHTRVRMINRPTSHMNRGTFFSLGMVPCVLFEACLISLAYSELILQDVRAALFPQLIKHHIELVKGTEQLRALGLQERFTNNESSSIMQG